MRKKTILDADIEGKRVAVKSNLKKFILSSPLVIKGF